MVGGDWWLVGGVWWAVGGRWIRGLVDWWVVRGGMGFRGDDRGYREVFEDAHPVVATITPGSPSGVHFRPLSVS